MSTERLYTRDEVGTILESVLMNLDNGIVASAVPKEEQMAKRIRRPVVVNGEKHWLTGATEQEVMDAYVRLCTKSGVIHNDTPTAPLLGDYIDEYFATFKNDQQSLTKINRNRIIKNHIKPRFGDWQISKITVSDLQQWFNELGNIYAHETLLKIKNTLSPVLDSAVEDEYITRNPLKSSRIKLGGRETVHHKAIPHEQFDDIHKRIDELDDRERKMAVLLCTTGMRFEEILGVCWEDIDSINGWITVRRAVVHPERNLPEVKAPKTRSSARQIPISKYWLQKLTPSYKQGFLLYSNKGKRGELPLSYTEARRAFNKIRKTFGLSDYSAHDFRDTCATEWREKGVSLDVVSRLLGHSDTETTEQRYVKYRCTTFDKVRDLMNPEN